MADQTNDVKEGQSTNDQQMQNGSGRTEERIRDLSSKVKETSEERDAAQKAKEEAEVKVAAAENKAAFLDSVYSKPEFQAAKQYEAEILEKVKKGYDMQDAILSVLNAKGELASADRTANVAATGGGSAPIGSTQGRGTIESKDPNNMSLEELREAMKHAETQGQIKLIG